jgi:hypothetical protein
MKFRVIAYWVAFALATHAARAVEDSSPFDPEEIVARTFENLYGFSSVQQVEISSGSPDGRKFVRSAQVIRAGASNGLNRMLIRFSRPADLRGVGILLRERDNFQYDAFLYQPILKKVRRVSMYQRHDAFFGTDLAFEDLEGKRSSQWDARLIRSEMKLGRKAWVIEMTPVGIPSGYAKMIGWFDQEKPVVVRFEFYLKENSGERFKIVDMDPARVVEKGGYYIPTHLKFAGSQGTETIVRISEIEIRESFPNSRFSPAALERGSERADAAGAVSQ